MKARPGDYWKLNEISERVHDRRLYHYNSKAVDDTGYNNYGVIIDNSNFKFVPDTGLVRVYRHGSIEVWDSTLKWIPWVFEYLIAQT